MTEDLETTSPYVTWWWDCPHCGAVHEVGDIEPTGIEVCSDCIERVRME